MKILFSFIPFDNGKSGISVYMRSVAAALREQGHDLTLIVENDAEKFFPGYKLVKAPAYTKKAVLSMLWHLFILPFKISKKDFDMCIIGAANRRSVAFSRVFTTQTVHDLSQYHIKGKYDIFRTFYIKRVLPFFVRRADAVMAISHSTENDLLKYWHVPQNKIAVSYNGLSIMPDPESPANWCGRLSLTPKKYILYISRLEVPGKNHINLIKAYEKLPASLKNEYSLVLAGSDWPGAEAVHEYAGKSPDSKNIHFTGFLANEDLPEAYRNAACYAFPSFFEGFGLSLIEAMHYGTPCVCSDNSSLGEIGRGAALLFNPADTDAMADSLKQILSDPSLRERLITAGHERAKEFDWSKHASALAATFKRSL